jgi:HSP20 family molecular chaperone IbpA
MRDISLRAVVEMGGTDPMEMSAASWENTQSGWRVRLQSPAWHPPTDLSETGDSYLVEVEVAGMKGDGFAIQFERGLLSIRGHRSSRRVASAYHQIEIARGEFATDVHIPGPVRVDEIEATYQNGLLRIALPKDTSKSISIGPRDR